MGGNGLPHAQEACREQVTMSRPCRAAPAASSAFPRLMFLLRWARFTFASHTPIIEIWKRLDDSPLLLTHHIPPCRKRLEVNVGMACRAVTVHGGLTTPPYIAYVSGVFDHLHVLHVLKCLWLHITSHVLHIVLVSKSQRRLALYAKLSDGEHHEATISAVSSPFGLRLQKSPFNHDALLDVSDRDIVCLQFSSSGSRTRKHRSQYGGV